MLQSVTAQQPFVMGSEAVKAAIAAIDGKPVEKTVIVPVLGPDRSDPEAVKAFREDLKKNQ